VFELATVTPQALKYDVIKYTPYEFHHMELRYFRKNYNTMKTYRWTTWNSNRLLQGRPRSSASLGLIIRFILTDWTKTVQRLRHWKFQLLLMWLALSLPCDVMLWNNKWEILKIISPLLSNVCHRPMITPPSPPLTRLIHISPSCWTTYHSFEIIFEMGTLYWIGLQIQCSIQIHCFKTKFSLV